jgi:hypothetical protein
VSIFDSDISSGHNPDHHHIYWRYQEHSIKFSWDVSRHKTSDVAKSFNQTLLQPYDPSKNCTRIGGCPSVIFPLGYENDSGFDWNQASYFPRELNLWFKFSIYNLAIGDGKTLTLRNVATAQGSKTNFWKQLLSLAKDTFETVLDLSSIAEAIAGDDAFGAVKSTASVVGDLKDTAEDAAKIVFENNWYVSQQRTETQLPFISHDLTKWQKNFGEPVGIVLFGEVTYPNGTVFSQPVLCFDGGDDHTFNLQLMQ